MAVDEKRGESETWKSESATTALVWPRLRIAGAELPWAAAAPIKAGPLARRRGVVVCVAVQAVRVLAARARPAGGFGPGGRAAAAGAVLAVPRAAARHALILQEVVATAVTAVARLAALREARGGARV